jgi:MoxR-like ATPase
MPTSKKTNVKNELPTIEPPILPEKPKASFLTKPLGLLGWERLEPILLAALATKEPLLLIGKHGTAKSFLLERLAQALELNYRFYNASLINYDDLVGIPVPNEQQTGLRYISTPTAIWDAQVVFIDELSRTRPDLQNKLFSIIHERRVQGIPLENLTYRWAAMNPPPTDEAGGETYLGAESLDPALADRFGFLIEVPDWSDLTDEDRSTILLDQFRGQHKFPVDVQKLIQKTEATFKILCAHPPNLSTYFIALEAKLRENGTRLSPRRISTLFRTTLGIQAARITLQQLDEKSETPSVETSLFLALSNGHPSLAERSLDQVGLLALHRHAWSIAGLENNNPWKTLLQIADPLERVVVASHADFPLPEDDLSSLVIEAVSSQSQEEKRCAVALVIYLKLRATKRLAAIAVETLATQLEPVLKFHDKTHDLHGGFALTQCHKVANLCSSLGDSAKDTYTKNLLNGFLPDGYKKITPEALHDFFRLLWDRFQLEEGAQ